MGICAESKTTMVEGPNRNFEIFVSYEELKAKFGKDVEKLPLGAVGIFTATQKIRTGLQQLMAGTEECEKVTGIPYVMRAYHKDAEKMLAQ